jgi:hypothetical protein
MPPAIESAANSTMRPSMSTQNEHRRLNPSRWVIERMQCLPAPSPNSRIGSASPQVRSSNPARPAAGECSKAQSRAFMSLVSPHDAGFPVAYLGSVVRQNGRLRVRPSQGLRKPGTESAYVP